MSDDFRLEKHPIVLMQPSVVPPFGWVGHVPFAYLAVDLLRPDCIVELGVHSGNSYLAMCQAVRELTLSTRCFAVDSWEGDSHAGQYGEQVYQSLRARHDPRYGDFSRLVRARFDDALVDFRERSIDLLHIDGLHTYEAVKHDFESWLPKMSDRAVVLLHDTVSEEHGFGVQKFFEELSQHYPCFSFLHSHGLGIVAIGDAVPAAFTSFMRKAQEDPASMRAFFEALALNLVDEGGHTRSLAPESQPVICHLYYREAHESFDDARKISVQVNAAEKVLDVQFRLPSGISPAYLRIDPADYPGVYSFQVWLRQAGADSLKFLNGLRERLGHVHGTLTPDMGPMGVGIASFDEDPYVEFEVGSEVGELPGDVALEVTIRISYEIVVTEPSVHRLLERSAMGDMRMLASTKIDVQNVARETAHRLAMVEAAIERLNEYHAVTEMEVAGRLDGIVQNIKQLSRRGFWGWLRRIKGVS